MADLQGRTVAFLESRRAAELAGLIERHNGVPCPAPCLSEVHTADAPELVQAVDQLCRGDAAVVIFLTGTGASTLFAAAGQHGQAAALQGALASARVAARGPKPLAVLRRQGVRVDLTAPPPHTSEALLEAMADWDLRGLTVAVQLYGDPNPPLLAALAGRGARVLPVVPYTWGPPPDLGPVRRLIDAVAAGQVDVLAATSASQVDNLFAIARAEGRESALREGLRRLPVAAQGPVCAAAFARWGVPVTVTPPTGHMGALVLAIAQHLTTAAAATTAAPALVQEAR